MSSTEAGFYVTGGTLRSDAPSYVERRADRELHECRGLAGRSKVGGGHRRRPGDALGGRESG